MAETSTVVAARMDRAWLELRYWAENHERFLARYPDEFLAVKDDSVVAHDRDFERLVEELHRLGLHPRDDVYIEFISARVLNL